MRLDTTDKQLINLYQRDLPVCDRPYQAMSRQLGIAEEEVIERLQSLQDSQVLSRVGPVFEHSRAGASLLAALAVPDEQIDLVAARVNLAPGVNHNYAREHTYNLWFVMTAPDEDTLEERLDELEHQLRLPMLRLPMVEAYHIDLGFEIDWEALP
ncbi:MULTISPECIES: AsnC family transcriptional regulator [unclassified Marinobacter]|jgi:siroheme decarboxylase|uniref:AsnC family transcriptional regulator n=1 Tax=unclassified Marinobacter TaxID=83889 RepID=UPI000D48FE70|nr:MULTISPECIES: AsnC family transcriptional regulator [unclassified Marinobacter]AXS83106.1 Lrp/AsnC family transcriptional regulator [Marinobacter sp. Arc7-DN-1]MCP4066207.1 Lrp/AsnC family transcriptional regulator [Gammaproteobacteria bacterium]PTB95189.1 AsnC family protein [Marinobacter sp. B9-2]|tara:strand:+ start:12031 stop:12495 length:465 start_codon:yes stop_codon:yes gene_type:complete